MKLRECDVLANGNGNNYLLAGTFGAMETVCHFGKDIIEVNELLSSGKIEPADIKHILMACLESINGKPVDDSEVEQAAIEFVEDFGFQESAILCQMLIHHALIGNVKKKQLRLSQPTIGMIMTLKTFLSLNLRKIGYCLGALLVSSVALACMIIKFY